MFDVNETLLDLAVLDGFFARLTGTPRARQEWFSLMIHSALTLTAARAYRPFGVVTLTNSIAEVAEDQLRNAGLRDLIQAVYSADEVRMLKPAPEPYRHVLDSQHASPAGALIAAHDWNIAGAAAAGLRTAFITREGQGPLPASASPAISATSLHAVAAELINAGQ